MLGLTMKIHRELSRVSKLFYSMRMCVCVCVHLTTPSYTHLHIPWLSIELYTSGLHTSPLHGIYIYTLIKILGN